MLRIVHTSNGFETRYLVMDCLVVVGDYRHLSFAELHVATGRAV